MIQTSGAKTKCELWKRSEGKWRIKDMETESEPESGSSVRCVTDGFPLSSRTATSIVSYGALNVPKWPIDIRSVVKAYAYMDSIFFAADVQSELADPANLADERTLHEKKMLKRHGDLDKHRPCVVVQFKKEPDQKNRYWLCPMAAFHEDGVYRQSYEDLEKPTSLLVRPVQTTNGNETFGDHIPYRFEPEWNKGPQYLFPIQISRKAHYVANHDLDQKMDLESFVQLKADIREASHVWKKWRNAEHVIVKSAADSQCSPLPMRVSLLKSLFSSSFQIKVVPTRLAQI
jgi:hypothetical protein